MRPRSWLIGVAAFSVALSTTSPSVAISKAGGKCSKAGATSGNLVCKKANGRLIWIKRVTTSGAASPTPTLTPRPTGTIQSIEPEVLYMDELLKELVSKVPKEQPFKDYTVVVEPVLIGTLWEKLMRDMIEPTLFLLAALDQTPDRSLTIYIGWTRDWLAENLKSTGSNCYREDKKFDGGEFCEEPFAVYVNTGTYNEKAGYPLNVQSLQLKQQIWVSGTMAHELGHMGANNGAGRKYGMRRGWPAWLREGWVEDFKLLVFAWSRGLTYSQVHAAWQYPADQCIGVKITELTEPKTYASGCEYITGSYAVEHLLYRTKDLEAQFRYHGIREKDQTDEEAFKQSFGIDYEDFVKSVTGYITKSYQIFQKR